jgi:hypothetical protein
VYKAGGTMIGMHLMYKCPQIVVKAVSVKITAAGASRSKNNMKLRVGDVSSPRDL